MILRLTKENPTEGFQVIHTPFQAPYANAYAERWIRTVREECLDHLLFLNETHLWLVLKTFNDYFNGARSHQGIYQQTPIPRKQPHTTGVIDRRAVSGGIINDYDSFPGSAPMYIS